ncbi:hypothetical protein AgCh_032497 [Apium graveolens]
MVDVMNLTGIKLYMLQLKISLGICDLRVHINCDGCKKKVKKIWQKIEGVYQIIIDSEQGKVTVAGNFDHDVLIKRLAKHGKIAELWDASESDNKKEDATVKESDGDKEVKKGSCTGQIDGNNQQQQQQVIDQPMPQVSQPPMPQIPNQQQTWGVPDQQKLQEMQQISNQQIKMHPQMNRPLRNGQKPNEQSAKLKGPKEDCLTGDDSDEYDSYDDDSEEDDVLLLQRPNQMKSMIGGGRRMPPNMMEMVLLTEEIPLPTDETGGSAGGETGANQSSENGGRPANGQKNGGSGGAGSGNNDNREKEDKGEKGVANNEVHVMPNMMGMGEEAGGFAGQMGSIMPMGHMGLIPMEKIGQMDQMPVVQGIPTAASGGNYFPEGSPEALLNFYRQMQQRLAAMMMDQQEANDNERIQHMMYVRPPLDVNYMPPNPYQQTSFPNYFSEENPTCSIM